MLLSTLILLLYWFSNNFNQDSVTRVAEYQSDTNTCCMIDKSCENIPPKNQLFFVFTLYCILVLSKMAQTHMDGLPGMLNHFAPLRRKRNNFGDPVMFHLLPILSKSFVYRKTNAIPRQHPQLETLFKVCPENKLPGNQNHVLSTYLFKDISYLHGYRIKSIQWSRQHCFPFEMEMPKSL